MESQRREPACLPNSLLTRTYISKQQLIKRAKQQIHMVVTRELKEASTKPSKEHVCHKIWLETDCIIERVHPDRNQARVVITIICHAPVQIMIIYIYISICCFRSVQPTCSPCNPHTELLVFLFPDWMCFSLAPSTRRCTDSALD